MELTEEQRKFRETPIESFKPKLYMTKTARETELELLLHKSLKLNEFLISIAEDFSKFEIPEISPLDRFELIAEIAGARTNITNFKNDCLEVLGE